MPDPNRMMEGAVIRVGANSCGLGLGLGYCFEIEVKRSVNRSGVTAECSSDPEAIYLLSQPEMMVCRPPSILHINHPFVPFSLDDTLSKWASLRAF